MNISTCAGSSTDNIKVEEEQNIYLCHLSLVPYHLSPDNHSVQLKLLWGSQEVGEAGGLVMDRGNKYIPPKLKNCSYTSQLFWLIIPPEYLCYLDGEAKEWYHQRKSFLNKAFRPTSKAILYRQFTPSKKKSYIKETHTQPRTAQLIDWIGHGDNSVKIQS